jgi:hypothetical protein
VGLHGDRNAIEIFLNGAKADGQAQNRGAIILNNAPAVTARAGQFRDHGRESWAKADSVFLRRNGFVRSSALRACVYLHGYILHKERD